MSGERSAKRRKEADAASDDGGSVVHELRDLVQYMKHEMASMHNKMDAMADKLNQVQDRNGNLEKSLQEMSDRQKYHEVLLRNQKWEYPVARPSQDYWDSLEDQAQINAAEFFINKIEKETRKMRLGIPRDESILRHITLDTGDPGDADRIMLPYSDHLKPYWEEFARALGEFSYYLKCSPKNELSGLGIGAVALPDDIQKMLLKALQSTHFDRLGFANSPREDNTLEGILKFALDYAESNPTLRGIVFGGHKIESQRQIERICAMIKLHPSIEEILLLGCRAEELNGHEMVRSIVASGRDKLKVIDLSENHLGTEEAAPLWDYLASNPILRELELADNRLDDSAAESLARALETNTNLRYLNLKSNGFSMHGSKVLKRVEWDGASLNSSADSNHTVLIRYPDDRFGSNFGPEEDTVHIEKPAADPKTLRAFKIYAVLASRNWECSNVEDFADVPIEVLPAILQSTQRYSHFWLSDQWWVGKRNNYVEPLSLFYEIFRNWDKALSLYESLGNPK